MSTLMCCVFQQETAGAHFCEMCQKPVHATCGESDKEDYGSHVV